MLRDISDWEHIGYGGKSTLEKEELMSPGGTKYLIKYPRQFKVGVSWEDITELIAAGFKIMESFDYWGNIKSEFIDMLLFDALIGNQDRHTYNWQLLFFANQGVKFSPIYDNGASLGFRFSDHQLQTMLLKEQEVTKYTNKTRVKAGLFEKKWVRAIDLLTYLSTNYEDEFKYSVQKLVKFDVVRYSNFIHSLNILSQAQRDWLLHIIPVRRKNILGWIGMEVEGYE